MSQWRYRRSDGRKERNSYDPPAKPAVRPINQCQELSALISNIGMLYNCL